MRWSDTILFFAPNVDAGSEYFLSNLRLAVGAPDTRNKLLTEGKWVTHGILFDVNSDKVKAESFGTLKEIATSCSCPHNVTAGAAEDQRRKWSKTAIAICCLKRRDFSVSECPQKNVCRNR
jgi:hypothetical protein